MQSSNGPLNSCFLVNVHSPDIPSNIYTERVADGGFCKYNQDPKSFEFKKGFAQCGRHRHVVPVTWEAEAGES